MLFRFSRTPRPGASDSLIASTFVGRLCLILSRELSLQPAPSVLPPALASELPPSPRRGASPKPSALVLCTLQAPSLSSFTARASLPGGEPLLLSRHLYCQDSSNLLASYLLLYGLTASHPLLFLPGLTWPHVSFLGQTQQTTINLVPEATCFS